MTETLAKFAVDKSDRINLTGQKPGVIWFTGLSGSGKSTLSSLLEVRLFNSGYLCYVLDGDNIRRGLSRNLSFSDEDRMENIRRVAEVARLFVDAGLIVIAAFISPFSVDRIRARDLFEKHEFIEIYLSASLEICEKRDPKGLYMRARKGEIQKFSGIDSGYEPPCSPELKLDTEKLSVQESIDSILDYLVLHKLINRERFRVGRKKTMMNVGS